MTYLMPTLPTVDEAVAMPEDEKVKLVVSIDAYLLHEAQTLKEATASLDANQAKYDAAFEAFKKEHADLIKAVDEDGVKVEAAEENLAKATIARCHLTGVKTYLNAFQARESFIADYDSTAMTKWVIEEAPTRLQRQLLKLDVVGVRKWLEGQNTEGSPRQIEHCAPFNAIYKKHYTGALLKAGLSVLPKPPMVPIYTPSDTERQAIIASTSTEVKKVVTVAPAEEEAEDSKVPF